MKYSSLVPVYRFPPKLYKVEFSRKETKYEGYHGRCARLNWVVRRRVFYEPCRRRIVLVCYDNVTRHEFVLMPSVWECKRQRTVAFRVRNSILSWPGSTERLRKRFAGRLRVLPGRPEKG